MKFEENFKRGHDFIKIIMFPDSDDPDFDDETDGDGSMMDND